MNSIEHIITKLHLKPHPEGGYFKETYRSTGIINADSLEASYNGERNYSTCIYFLLTSDNFSALHRIKQDEIWHFYDGSPIRLHMITEAGKYTEHIIGKDLSKGELPQFVAPGGCWFAAEVVEGDTFSLTGCTVSPGFSFEDFELKSKKELTDLFPHLKSIIAKLTHD
ncbi:cupin domain-containing protein [Winogradskyella luteola]|uniref:Cupin domain-containing protein n=1 Tax=Winogradskyella luteola TaxID=2828330 RepID=A0A9X1F5Q6_9FLAO|nr:cupin domain-containing protein [Winogradskyella luteola]MBV7267606.1 cupin domain-containing protein [Winogradskyella luteola]